MIEADLLARELGGLAPHVRVSESLPPVAVDRVAHHADVGILLHDHRIRHVRLFPLRLQEDAHESEGRVDLVLQPREADALLRGDRDELPSRQLGLELLHVVRGDEVDLVHDDEGSQEHAVPREDVDQLVFRDVLPHDDRAVQVAPLPADVRDHLRVELRELDRRIHGEPAAVRLRQGDVRGPLVQANPGEMQFVHQDIDVGLEDVDHEDEQIARPGDGQDLLPSTAALRRAPDEPGHVEHLDLLPPVLHEAGDHVQRREVVRGHLARRVRDLVQEGRFADAREADQPDRRVPALLDRVARPSAAPLEAPCLLLVLEPREFRLQPPDVVLGRLVVRRLLDLVFDRLDLFLDRHLDTGPIRRSAKRFLPASGYQTVRMPSGSRPLTAYRTIRRERAVYGDRSRPPRTRWTNRPSASSISLSSASVYARTEAVNSRVPFRSMITWRVSNRPRSRSNDASSRTTVPSSRACQFYDGNPATRLSRLNNSIRNFPRGRSARPIPRKTSRSSSGRSK